MLTQTYYDILQSREDISDYVFHFTKQHEAKDTLETIINERKIRDIKGSGYICFTEAPITMLPSMFRLFKRWYDPMYAPFGVGIKKDLFYKMGGRQVIYGETAEKESLKSIGWDWRFVKLEPGIEDFSWLREWRIQAFEISLTYDNCIIVAETDKDEEEIVFGFDDMEIEAEPADGGFEYSYTGIFKRLFKCVTIEQLSKLESMSKAELDRLLKENQPQEYQKYLGSEWR